MDIGKRIGGLGSHMYSGLFLSTCQHLQVGQAELQGTKTGKPPLRYNQWTKRLHPGCQVNSYPEGTAKVWALVHIFLQSDPL